MTKLITVARYPDYIKAELARQALEDCGIKAILTGMNSANVYSLPTIAEVELQVEQKNADEALEILDSLTSNTGRSDGMSEFMQDDFDKDKDEDEQEDEDY